MNSVLLPIASASAGRAAAISFATSTVFAAGFFVIEIVSDGSPLTREIAVTGFETISTSATSAIVTTVRPPSSGSPAMSSAEVSADPACTVSSESPSSMTPVASSTPLASSASRIDWVLRPFAASAVRSGVIVTRWPLAPESVAWPTPGRLAMSTIVWSRSTADSSSASRSLVTASTTIGKSLSEKLTTWVSTAAGSESSMRLRASWIFCSARARSVP